MQGKELQTSALVEDALQQGKTVFVPYIHTLPGTRDSEMQMLALESKSDYSSLQRDKWGIPSLATSSIPTRENSFGGNGIKTGTSNDKLLDMIVMPGVAFDSKFGRLGHGKGYYDSFLRRCSRAAQASSVSMPRLGALPSVLYLPSSV